MELENLDLMKFFKDEYGKINGGKGIGGSGIITPNQMINVVNIDGDDDNKSSEENWGIGYHYDTFTEIFKKIYGLEDDGMWINSSEKEKIIDKLLDRVITIRYVNQYERCSQKYAIIKVPAFITTTQYNNLIILNELFEMCLKKYKISIKVVLKGIVFYPKEYIKFNQKYFDLKVNNLPDALLYLKENNRINDGNLIYATFISEKENIEIGKKLKKR